MLPVTELEKVRESPRKGGFRSLSVCERVLCGAHWSLGGAQLDARSAKVCDLSERTQGRRVEAARQKMLGNVQVCVLHRGSADTEDLDPSRERIADGLHLRVAHEGRSSENQLVHVDVGEAFEAGYGPVYVARVDGVPSLAGDAQALLRDTLHVSGEAVLVAHVVEDELDAVAGGLRCVVGSVGECIRSQGEEGGDRTLHVAEGFEEVCFPGAVGAVDACEAVQVVVPMGAFWRVEGAYCR